GGFVRLDCDSRSQESDAIHRAHRSRRGEGEPDFHGLGAPGTVRRREEIEHGFVQGTRRPSHRFLHKGEDGLFGLFSLAVPMQSEDGFALTLALSPTGTIQMDWVAQPTWLCSAATCRRVWSVAGAHRSVLPESGGLVARQHGQVARATLIFTESVMAWLVVRGWLSVVFTNHRNKLPATCH